MSIFIANEYCIPSKIALTTPSKAYASEIYSLTWTFSYKCSDVIRFFQCVTGQPNNSNQAQNDKLMSGRHCELKQKNYLHKIKMDCCSLITINIF